MSTAKTYFRFKLLCLLLPLILIFIGGVMSCQNQGMEKKKIVYINSYHSGFPPSAQITNAVTKEFLSDSFELSTFFMDTKRNSSEAYILMRADELLDSIRKIKPDVLIVSDDNALKYLVVPNFQEDPLPIVFCGINWTVEEYDISACNITGVLEILPVSDLIKSLKPYYPEMKNIMVLNENTTTSRKTQLLLDTLLGNIGLNVKHEMVDNFESWKSAYIEANETYDIIYFQTIGAIKGWDHDEVIKLIDQHIKIPMVTCEEFMMPYAVYGLTQLSEEQGMIASEMAKLILKGTSPSEIPIERNKMSKIWINPRLAQKIGFQPDEILLNNAIIAE